MEHGRRPLASTGMCRSIKTLRTEPVVTSEDVHAAALQYVRKISGYRQPSRRNEAVFARAVEEISAATATLLADLEAAASDR